MGKYVVVKIINSSLDACTIHAGTNPSGVCVCSTGDDTPWVFVESGIYEQKDNAWHCAKLLFEQLLAEFRSKGTNDGWEIIDDGSCAFAVSINEDEGAGKSIWFAKVTVLEIPEV